MEVGAIPSRGGFSYPITGVFNTSQPRSSFRLPFGQGTNEDFEPEPTIGGGNDAEQKDGGLPVEQEERTVIAKAYVWLINPFSRREGEQKPPLPRIFEKFRR